MLVAESLAAGVDTRMAHHITGVRHDGCFRVETDRGMFSAPALVIATGGLSIPKMGATGFAYDVARQFGVAVVPPAPALVPLTFAEPVLGMMRALSGTACEVIATVGRAAFREALLFTHRGLSGPAILQASSYLAGEDELTVDLLPGQDALAWLLARKRERPRIVLRTALAEVLPQRLAQAMAPEEDAPPIGGVTDRVPGSDGGPAEALAAAAVRHRGLCQGRGHARRHRHAGLVLADDGGPERSGPLFRGRGGGRDGVARRLQFPMGLGERFCSRSRSLRVPRALTVGALAHPGKLPAKANSPIGLRGLGASRPCRNSGRMDLSPSRPTAAAASTRYPAGKLSSVKARGMSKPTMPWACQPSFAPCSAKDAQPAPQSKEWLCEGQAFQRPAAASASWRQ